MPRVINKIIIHCSDSNFGDAKIIEDWHRERGFKSIGYHYIILNGVRTHGAIYLDNFDGAIEEGRHIDLPGAHCVGENESSIGICLIGKATFTDKQFATLEKLIRKIMKDYSIPIENIIGHCETRTGKEQRKSCPNFDVEQLRNRVAHA